MRRPLAALTFILLTSTALAVDRVPAEIVSFARPALNRPGGWQTAPREGITADRDAARDGKPSLRIVRSAQSPGEFSAISLALPIDFAGNEIELRGWLRTDQVTTMAGLFLVEDDGAGKAVAFDNMERRPVRGTADWAEFSVSLAIQPDARSVRIGALMSGTGTSWVNDLRVFVDGQPLAQREFRPRPAIETDHEFDEGSRLSLATLSGQQVETLALLAKVWGLLKYHDPRITSGDRQWDYEVFRIVPTLLEKDTRDAVDESLLAWINGLGRNRPCERCATLDESALETRPNLAWITDTARLGAPLSRRLQEIVHDRPTAKRQFYIVMAPNVGNPSFDHEPDYRGVSLDDRGFRLLAVMRLWNMIEYWFPYRALLDDWDAALVDALPRIVLAPDSATYQRELMALIARVQDTHANLWSSMAVLPPTGACRVPIVLRFVEGTRLVIAGAPGDGLAIGDEVLAIDGDPVDRLVRERKRFYAASNEAARLRDMARYITRGDCGPVRLSVRRADGDHTIDAVRSATKDPPFPTHDLPGPTFRLLSDEVAYLKLSSIRIEDLPGYLDAAANTKGLVIDLRNYPSAFVVFALGGHLIDRPLPFVRFTRADPANPGAFQWSEPLTLAPLAPRYRGKVVILVDEVSQSQAEYTAMALRTAPGALVVGSTTAGADGNVSTIPLPGGLKSMISGIGIFYPDRRPTQRIGIVPDIEVRPTLAGLRAGRDEVLEAGVQAIVGADAATELMDRLPSR